MPEFASSPLLEIRYENRRPVELLDFSNSLAAIAERYRELDAMYGVRRSGRLYVREMRPGSIIADLIPLLEPVSALMDHRETLAAFMASLDDLFRLFHQYTPRLRERVSTRSARQVQRILNPTANDRGSQLFLTINVEGDLHIDPSIQIDTERARAIQRGTQRFLQDGPLPTPNRIYSRQVH